MTEEEMLQHLETLRSNRSRSMVVGEGVVFSSERDVSDYCAYHDLDPVHIGAGWLAKNRVTHRRPIDTEPGDVVIRRELQRFRVWTVETKGAQDPPVAGELVFWNRPEAESAAQTQAVANSGRIFWIQPDDRWSEIARLPSSRSASL